MGSDLSVYVGRSGRDVLGVIPFGFQRSLDALLHELRQFVLVHLAHLMRERVLWKSVIER